MYRNLGPVFALVVIASCVGPAPDEVSVGVTSATAKKVRLALDPTTIPKYVDPLPLPARIDATAGTSITLTVSEFEQQVLPATFSRTLVWGYDGSYPGPTIEARRGVPLRVTYVNDLVSPVLQSVLKVDQTLEWADPLHTGCPSANPACFLAYSGPVPIVTHLHDGEVQAAFDGGPNSWFTPGLASTGSSFVSNEYVYNNSQEAGTLWYHDHAIGITRLNVYAGLAGFYLLRDPINESSTLPGGSGDPASVNGPFEREIVIQDRMFDVNGQLVFPSAGINPTVHPFWVPEFFGDVIVVNGKSWPYLNVEPRKYRFRLLNGSNARFYDLAFDDGTPFTVIGGDGAYHDAPVQTGRITISPGERVQVVVDFTGRTPGTRLLLTNGAKAPFPSGAPADPRTVGQIMQFRVVVPSTLTDPSVVPANLRPNNPIVRLTNPVVKRQLTLNEVLGAGGPLQMQLNNTSYRSAATERPRVGATEEWEIINLTADAHPIHLHLVHMQLLDRQRIQTNKYVKAYAAAFPLGVVMPGSGPPLAYGTPNADGAIGGNPAVTPFLQQAPTPPEPSESGWKDTIRANPGEVTRIMIRWAPTHVPVNDVSAGTNTFPFDPTVGGYVWHCHIIDHEDNEMMRPMEVVP
jgi:spore coat protein A, manganese oxidase